MNLYTWDISTTKMKKNNVNGNQMFQWQKNDLHLSMKMICNKLKPIARYNLMYAKNFNNKNEEEQCNGNQIFQWQKRPTFQHENDL